MQVVPNLEFKRAEAGWLLKLSSNIGIMSNFGVAEKIYSIIAALGLLTLLLLAMSIQSLRLQNAYRHDLATSSTAAINIERATGLIYAVVMESRGIYMSTDPLQVKRYGDELLRRNRDLAKVVVEWGNAIRDDDAAQFAVFKKRIVQFIDFRNELVRLAVEVGPAAGREWGFNPANLANRTALTDDLEKLARIYAQRTAEVAELGSLTQLASWYLASLGLGVLLLAALNVFVIRRFVTTPLADITQATDRLTAGEIEVDIPYLGREDEIGRLAHAVQNFRDALSRNRDLEELEIGTAKQRDAALGQRDQLNDKYYATKWQLSAAINSMPQGMVMLDAGAKVLVINEQFRRMYGLSPEIKAGSSLNDILQHRVKKGLFSGNVADFLAAIIARMAKREPSTSEIELTDGRQIRISEQAMAGGGWVAIHDDLTEQRRMQRILERTERFLVTVIENIPEAIIARDVRSMRYIFVNAAAEKVFGLPRSAIMGKTARELYSAETVELIERQDQEMLAGRQLEVDIRTVDTPNNGQRLMAVRRLLLDDKDSDSRVFITMLEDRTEAVAAAA